MTPEAVARATTGATTSGPWRLLRDSTGDWLVVHNGRAEVVCILKSHQTEDARLIASAPDLLVALKELMAAEHPPYRGPLQYDSLREDAWDAARAAVAKAERRTP